MLEMIPFGRGRDLFAEMDRLERALLQPLSEGETLFRTDITEKEKSYVLRAELPGFNKEEIRIDVREGRLVIRAEHTRTEETTEKERVIRRETHTGKYERSFHISHIDEENIRAKYENGILELELPKETQEEPPVRSVQIQ